MRIGRRPRRSEAEPAASDITPQAALRSPTRLPTAASSVPRSRAMSRRNGAMEVEAPETRNVAQISVPRKDVTPRARGPFGGSGSAVNAGLARAAGPGDGEG